MFLVAVLDIFVDKLVPGLEQAVGLRLGIYPVWIVILAGYPFTPEELAHIVRIGLFLGHGFRLLHLLDGLFILFGCHIHRGGSLSAGGDTVDELILIGNKDIFCVRNVRDGDSQLIKRALVIEYV